MDQLTFSEAEYQNKKRKTRREIFLERMDKLIPWSQMDNRVANHRGYAQSLFDDIEQVDLLWVDGPPGATCLFSRYPALPALADKLSPHAEVWLDDTIRQEEKYICERWAKDYGFTVAY